MRLRPELMELQLNNVATSPDAVDCGAVAPIDKADRRPLLAVVQALVVVRDDMLVARGDCSAVRSGESPRRRQATRARSVVVTKPLASGSSSWKSAEAADGQDRGATRLASARSYCYRVSAGREEGAEAACLRITDGGRGATQCEYTQTHAVPNLKRTGKRFSYCSRRELGRGSDLPLSTYRLPDFECH